MSARSLLVLVAGAPLRLREATSDGAEETAEADLSWPAAIILCAVFLAASVYVYELGRRGQKHQLRPFRFGFRTPETTKSENAWYAAHRAAGPWLQLGGAAGALGSLMFLLRPEEPVLTVLLGLLGAMVVCVVIGWALGRRAARKTR